jgi:hypothetical protein
MFSQSIDKWDVDKNMVNVEQFKHDKVEVFKNLMPKETKIVKD